MGVGESRIPEEINPYKILNISPCTHITQCQEAFRKLVTSSNTEKKKKAALANDILCNKEKYIQKGNLYSVKKKDCFYYATIGDLGNLKELYNYDDNIIKEKDNLGRNLLYIAAKNGFYDICEFLLAKGLDPNETQKTNSTPLHAAAYYNHYNIVRLLLEYRAKINIKNNDNHTAFDEGYSQKIREIILKNNKDIINKLFDELTKKNLAKELIFIKYDNMLIGKKIIRSDEKMPNNIQDIREKWETAWHGTKYEFLESIMTYGLYPSGSKLENGFEIKPLDGHVPLGIEVEDIKDWAKAIFVSPSIFYAGHPVYAQTLISNDMKYSILVETKIKPGSYRKFPPTIVKGIQKNGEPALVEYRIQVKDESNLIMRIESEMNVVVTSILFAKTEFLEKIKDYYKGEIFVNSEEEKRLFRT